MASSSTCTVDFFIVGAQKGGTTSLDLHLRQIPGIQMACHKEIHFFDDERQDWANPDVGRLHGFFTWQSPEEESSTLRGEATPIYSYWPHAIERIRRYSPSARLIMCLRHPAHRAYSHWHMETQRSAETLSFSEAISATGRKRVSSSPSGVHRVYSYVERGFYSAQIGRMLSLFPRDQLHFLRTDHLWSNPDTTVRNVMSFLGIRPIQKRQERVAGPSGAGTLGRVSAATPEEIAGLTALYAEDIRTTETMTGLSLSDWLDDAYREPTAP